MKRTNFSDLTDINKQLRDFHNTPVYIRPEFPCFYYQEYPLFCEMLQKGDIAFQQEKFMEAKQYYFDALSEGGRVIALFRIAKVGLKLKEYENALKDLTLIINSEDDEFICYYQSLLLKYDILIFLQKDYQEITNYYNLAINIIKSKQAKLIDCYKGRQISHPGDESVFAMLEALIDKFSTTRERYQFGNEHI